MKDGNVLKSSGLNLAVPVKKQCCPLSFLKKLCQSLSFLNFTIGVDKISREDLKRLSLWQEKGYAADMDYMYRAQKSNLRDFFNFKSVIVFAVYYSAVEHPKLKEGYGRVARYAWGRDYHRVIKKIAKGVVEEVSNYLKRPINYKVFTDAVPILERALARASSFCFIGKNSMAIQRGKGSYFFLGELFWDVDVEYDEVKEQGRFLGDCGRCSRCISSCPTSAIVEDRVIDASKCISYLTIEKRGSLSEWEREAIGEWVFGCDICQDVCPFNYSSRKREEAGYEKFRGSEGVGPLLSLRWALTCSEEEFLRRCRGTPLMRAKWEGMARNACCVAANTGATSLVGVLREVVLLHPSALVRQHSLWSLYKFYERGIDRKQFKRVLNKVWSTDKEATVRREAEGILERL